MRKQRNRAREYEKVQELRPGKQFSDIRQRYAILVKVNLGKSSFDKFNPWINFAKVTKSALAFSAMYIIDPCNFTILKSENNTKI